MTTMDLLFEIGTEELPSSVVDLWTGRQGPKGADETMPQRIAREVKEELRLDFEDIWVTGTPRRLILSLRGVPAFQPSLTRESRGPATSVAYDAEGRPTKAAEGFARGQGIPVERLERRTTEQGEYIYAVVEQEGLPAPAVLFDYLPQLVKSLPLPKAMRWGSGDLRFSRPIRWLLCLFGGEVLEIELDGLTAGRTTFGHRFMAPGAIQVEGLDDYLVKLKSAHVIVDQKERQQLCVDLVNKQADQRALRPIIAKKVMDEVANLVEHPTAGCGSFDPDFLQLPREVLITSMQSHQRYFPAEDGEGKLAANFFVIQNGNPASNELVVTGHQRVLSARLSDALFFYSEDKQVRLEKLLPRLDGVTYHGKLGSLLDKVKRIESIAGALCSQLEVDTAVRERATRAAHLCKADLLTNMVTEFPDLQGVMGREYARLENEPLQVAAAIYEHYLPRARADQDFPETLEGSIVSLADKLDSVVAFLSVGIAPSGSQDPYALRRQASGVVRLITEKGIRPDLSAVVDSVFASLKETGVRYAEDENGTPKHRRDIAELLFDQLRRDLLNKNIRYDVIDSTFAPALESGDPLAVDLAAVAAKASFLNTQLSSAELENVVVTFTRCRNLTKGVEAGSVRKELLADEAEKELAAALDEFENPYDRAITAGDYSQAWQLLSALRPPVDRFFDDVLVMAPEDELRHNRQMLLANLVSHGFRLADFSKVVQEKS